MVVGVTGHQKRDGIDWSWVSFALRLQLTKLSATKGLSCLAEGTDQIFARAAQALDVRLTAVIPLDNYERFFSPQGLVEYLDLLGKSTAISLHYQGDPEKAFLSAGRYIVDQCDVLLAVWDGHHAEGVGGTGDVVHYALTKGRKTLHLNPCEETVNLLDDRRDLT